MLLLFVIPCLVLLAVLAWMRPGTAVALWAAVMPAYLLRFNVGGVPTNFFEVGLVVLFITLGSRQEIRASWRKVLQEIPSVLKFWTVLFVLSALMGVVVADVNLSSLGIFKSWIVLPVLFGWMVYWLAANKDGGLFVQMLFRYIIFSGFIVSVWGLLQVGELERVKGVYVVPNSLALYLAPLVIIALGLFVANKSKKYWGAMALVMMAAIVATQSVAGIVAVLTVALPLVIATWRSQGSKKRLLWLSGVLVLFGLLALSVLYNSGKLEYLARPFLGSENYSSLSVRGQLWSVSLGLIKENPWLGVGLGEFEPHYQRDLHLRFSSYEKCLDLGKDCQAPIAEFVYRDPHSWPLAFWLNLGFLGLVSFASLNILAVVFYYKNRKDFVARAAVAAIVVMLIFGLTDTVYWKNDLAVLYWLLIGVLGGLAHLYKGGTYDGKNGPRR